MLVAFSRLPQGRRAKPRGKSHGNGRRTRPMPTQRRPTASGHSSAAMQTRPGRYDRAHNRRSNFSNESTESNHGIRHRYALCRQCHRMLPLHHFLHLLRRDAHRCRPDAQVPTHDWRTCRASRRKRPRPLDRDQHKRAPALCATTELFNHERARTAPRLKLRPCRRKPHRIFATFGLGERFGSLD